MTDTHWSGGLDADKELFFAERPDDPEMRESSSIWLFDDKGEFASPRFGIEAEAKSWDNRMVQGNFAFADGRVLAGAQMGEGHSPFGPDGRPTHFGAGPVSFDLIEPFKRWRILWDGTAVDGTVQQQIANELDQNKRVPVKLEAELTMVTPCWVQDLQPETVAKMTPAEQIEAENMGIGWRLEHMFTGEGSVTIDGATRHFTCRGSRIKRQSVRPLAGFRGHCWQGAVFPDGRAFAFIAYPNRDDGTESYNDGYVYQDGRMYPAKASKIPWLRRVSSGPDDASLELTSELGVTRIAGTTGLSNFRCRSPLLNGLDIQQGGVHYTWDGNNAWGMIERSSHDDLVTIE